MKRHKMQVGDKVLIVEDIRDGQNAKGQIAEYEGEFPFSVTLTNDNGQTWFRECDYDAFVQNETLLQLFPLWEGGERGDSFAMVMRNPRFILPDNSKIWGAECWWTEKIEQAIPEAESDLRELKDFIREVVSDHATQE